MNTPLSIFLNKTVFYNKKTAILYFISLYFLVFLIFLDKGFETNKGNLFLISILYFCISICLIKLIKQNNYTFHKFSFNTDEYKFSSRKEKMICYKESFNRLSKNNIQSKDLGYNENETINKFLLNFNNTFNKDLMRSITFERFNDYLIYSKGYRTTGQLFYTQYRSSLIKITKDFLINTNKLEDVSNETISKFINNLTTLDNLNFDSDKGLHYNDKLVFEFLENIHNQKTSIVIEQEYSIPEQIKPIKLKHISKSEFYKVLEQISIDVLNVKLTKDDKEELKSFVGMFFITESKCKFNYNSKITQLNFINSENSKLFIKILRYLQDKSMTNLYNIDLIRTLNLIIKNDSINTDSNKRINFIKSVTYQKLTPKQTKNIDAVLRSLKNKYI
ncbi:hypothetical protein [Empedobacter stercoris]|uniref:Uncharacterized protein n=1 Tax=Empedobacter stercoris TaxID=1628248 RepID=A0ABX1WM79_9FLAO|nr:hypothetical protein [Empedobacter stercoris]NOJ75705.1 hypothetical protein [Empedobacter stercoris]